MLESLLSASGEGYFGRYGGRFVAETLVEPLDELTAAFAEARQDAAFQRELSGLLAEFSGRPTPLYYAERLSEYAGGARILLKREDLGHTGSHKINNALGQVLLARRMGKRRIIAETGAGQHGVATATVCARFGLECVVYMGAEDMKRQALNVFRMRLMGAEVRSVEAGSKTLKDAINEALRDWVTNVRDTYYLLGSALGPHPYPTMVREFQRVIGDEARRRCWRAKAACRMRWWPVSAAAPTPSALFTAFVADKNVRLIGVEAGGRGESLGDHAARFHGGAPGVLQGTYSYVLQDDDGQIAPTHSVSAGLDYASVGPEHAHLRELGRAEYVSADDAEALEAFDLLSRREGIIPALESAHAVSLCGKAGPGARSKMD